MTRLAQRLGKLRDASGFSICDLAAWVEVSEGAVRSWLKGVQPQAYTLARVDQALTYLEKEIKRQKGPIVPLHVRQGDRRSYVTTLRDSYPNV